MMVTPEKKEDDPRSCRQLQLVPASRFGLPDGWSVEERPRRSSQTVDKVSYSILTSVVYACDQMQVLCSYVYMFLCLTSIENLSRILMGENWCFKCPCNFNPGSSEVKRMKED